MTSLTHDQITIQGSYIIRKTLDGVQKEQFVTIESYSKEEDIYNYHYGFIRSHEGCCKLDKIRVLTESEEALRSTGSNLRLPQQFYQSIP